MLVIVYSTTMKGDIIAAEQLSSNSRIDSALILIKIAVYSITVVTTVPMV